MSRLLVPPPPPPPIPHVPPRALRYFKDVKDASGQALECLGQGGRDPLSETLAKGLYADGAANLNSASVEWAFWNDEFQATANSYDQVRSAGGSLDFF